MAIRLTLTIIAASSFFCDQVRGEDDALGEQQMIKVVQVFLAQYDNVVLVRDVNSNEGKREAVVIKGVPAAKGAPVEVLKSLVKLGDIYLNNLHENGSNAAITGVMFCNNTHSPWHDRTRLYRLKDDGSFFGTNITLKDLLKVRNLELLRQKNEIENAAEGKRGQKMGVEGNDTRKLKDKMRQ